MSDTKDEIPPKQSRKRGRKPTQDTTSDLPDVSVGPSKRKKPSSKSPPKRKTPSKAKSGAVKARTVTKKQSPKTKGKRASKTTRKASEETENESDSATNDVSPRGGGRGRGRGSRGPRGGRGRATPRRPNRGRSQCIWVRKDEDPYDVLARIGITDAVVTPWASRGRGRSSRGRRR